MNRDDRYDADKVIPWFLGHEPEDFRFDPISRLYVPGSQENPNAIAGTNR